MNEAAPITVDFAFLHEVEERSGQPVATCYQCRKCTAGCPTAYLMEYDPARIVHQVQMGEREALLASQAIWMCVGCETCGTRCPNRICIGRVNDALRQMAVEAGAAIGERRVYQFHRAFLNNIRYFGRVHELSMTVEYKLRSMDLLSNLDFGVKLIRAGKLPILPQPIAGRDQIARLFELESRHSESEGDAQGGE